MPFGKLGIVLQGTLAPAIAASRFVLIRSSCKPTLKGLQSTSDVLNGPAAVLLIPSGKKGRCRKPPARSVKATDPSNFRPSAAARSTYEPKPALLKEAPAPARE